MGKKLALFCGSTLCALLIVEIALRVLGVSYPIFTRMDDELGFALRPHAKGYHNDEARAYISINSQGFRDREHREKDGPRIAILGDSFTEARQVDIEHTFWNQIDCAQVMNFGVSGYGTAQQYLQLQRDVLPHDPDLVVLAFFTGNDIINNSSEINPGEQPYYLGDGEWDYSFNETESFQKLSSKKRDILANTVNKSRILQLLNRVRTVRTVQDVKQKQSEAPPPDPEALERAWKLTEELILLIRNASPELLLMVIPPKEGDLEAEERLAAFAKREGLNILTVSHVLRPEHYIDHFSVEGHMIVGEALSRRTCKILQENK